MRRKNWSIVLALLLSISSFAKEGMWVPLLIEQLNYEDLKANGFKLTAEDIYSVNKASLKDAVVIFGGGCTGEVISDKGLLLTNHHCGFSNIQRHSTLENNYLRDGFWAKSYEEELPNPGLSVKFLVKIEEFTDLVLSDIDKSLAYHKQKPHIAKRIEELERAIEDTTNYGVSIESFYSGNKYYLFLYNEYMDVRLVGAPPISIGNFGGDPDNWVWPRHTGDFSVFRIYTGANGKPAPYSKDNVPLIPKKFLTINAQGIKPGDFTMVLGYPGKTYEYLFSGELELLGDKVYPARIRTRTGRLEIIDKARSKDEKLYIQYATKQKRISNSWKKWKGILYGFERFNVIEKRKEYEKWLMANAGSRKNELSNLYKLFEDAYSGFERYLLAGDLFLESAVTVEPFDLHTKAITEALIKKDSESLDKALAIGEGYFKNYNVDIDRKLTKFLLWNYKNNLSEEFHPKTIAGYTDKKSLDEFIDKVYEKSVYTDPQRFVDAVNKAKKGKYKAFEKDPFFILYNELYDIYREQIIDSYEYYRNQLDNLNKEYILLIKSIDKKRLVYPDANLTMRMSYGKVEAYSPADAVHYHHQTYLSGIVQKENSGHEDYAVDEKLKKLYENKDYGKYAEKDGKLPVCFIASNHTSGGNSGSPVMDAEGRLIGINFDRTWEGTMSDFNFDERICRNISVDIRYVLFVIDKFAGAGYLLNEMDIIW